MHYISESRLQRPTSYIHVHCNSFANGLRALLATVAAAAAATTNTVFDHVITSDDAASPSPLDGAAGRRVIV